MSEFAPHAEYLGARGFDDSKFIVRNFALLNAVTTRSETGFVSPSIRVDYRDLNGTPTGHARWRLLTPPADGRKFHQRAGSGNRAYFPELPAKAKKRWAKIATDPKVRIVITEGEFKAAAACRAGIVTVGIGGVDSWRGKDGALIPDLAQIVWKKRVVDLVPDADHQTNLNVRRAFLTLAETLTELGAVVRVRPLIDVKGTGKSGLDDYLMKYDAADFEKLTAHGMDSDLIRRWRQDVVDGSELPEFDLAPLDPDRLDKPMPPLEFTVQALIPVGTVALMVAEGGVGKTHLALELSRAVASGDTFLGLATLPGGVVYIGLEDPPDILRRRFYHAHARRLAELRARPDGSFDRKAKDLRRALLERLRIVSLAGQELHLVGLRGGVVIQAPALDDLIEKLREERIGLLILDPMARLHGTDENSNQTGTAVVNAAERIAREIGCTVVIPHHTGKSAATRDDQYAARGASGLADAARVVLRLRTLHEKELKSLTGVDTDGQENNFLKLVHSKSNYAPRFQDLWLKRTETGSLVAFTPSFRDADDDHAMALGRLQAWAATQPDGAFTRTGVKDNYKAILGGGRAAALKFFDEAVCRNDLRATGESRKGGALYVIATAKAVPDAD